MMLLVFINIASMRNFFLLSSFAFLSFSVSVFAVDEVDPNVPLDISSSLEIMETSSNFDPEVPLEISTEAVLLTDGIAVEIDREADILVQPLNPVMNNMQEPEKPSVSFDSEGVVETKKPNIFVRIWRMIKKFFGFGS